VNDSPGGWLPLVSRKVFHIMARSYVPTLRVIFRTAYKYAVRWHPQLTAHLTETQEACLVSTITALADCLAALGEAVIEQ
jgi:hypothetical protein